MAFAVPGLAIALIGAVIGLIVCMARAAAQRRRFSAIVDVDGEVARLRSVATQEIAQRKAAAASDAAQRKEETTRLRAAAAAEADSIRRTVQAEREHHARLASETARVQAHFDRLSEELRRLEGSLTDRVAMTSTMAKLASRPGREDRAGEATSPPGE